MVVRGYKNGDPCYIAAKYFVQFSLNKAKHVSNEFLALREEIGTQNVSSM